MKIVLAVVTLAMTPLVGAPSRYLFLDPAFLLEAEHAVLHVNSPQQREVVVKPGKPWEQQSIGAFITVRNEGGRGKSACRL